MKNRRDFFKKSFLAVGSLSLIPLGKLWAIDCPDDPKDESVLGKLLKPDSPTAKRLDYFANAADATDHKKFKEGSNCKNCRFYQIKKEKEDHAPCTMAGMKYVPNCGWCKTYNRHPKRS